MNALENLWHSVLGAVPGVLAALLLLVLAYVVAKIAKKVVMKALGLLGVERHLDKIGIEDETSGNSLEYVGKFVFLIVFLLFLPGVLDQLGIPSVSQPIAGMVSEVLHYVPNLLAAALILVVGFFIAGLVRQLTGPLLKRLGVDKIQEKLGAVESETPVSSMLAYVVYVVILVPVLIAALQVLGITAISAPAVAMLDSIFAFLPRIFVAIAVVLVGVLIAKLAGELLTEILSSVGADQLMGKVIKDETRLGSFSLSAFVGGLVKYIIMLLFAVEALNVVQLEVLQTFGAAVVAYLPFAISAVIIMGVGLFLATWTESSMNSRFPQWKMTPLIAKATIIAVAAFMTLNQLGIATDIVNAAFIIILGAAGIAFAVAFGVGGRHFAASTLQRFEEKNLGDT